MSRPIRIAHLGLGTFSRSHQAWYTAHAPDGSEWGISGFTGRSTRLADALNAQGGRYTLIERAADGDRAEVVDSIVTAHAGTEHDAWLATLASPDLAVVTLTVTEAGYDAASAIPGRLTAGLRVRRDAGGGPIALIPCDNLPNNAAALETAVHSAATGTPDLLEWVAHNASFVSTVVDRITPATTDEDRELARHLTGTDDACPVVTEPFSEWILSGRFPAGRPRWEDAGARFVDDIDAYERRKLWLLNGAHSLLAYAGGLRGHNTVAEAVADKACTEWVEEWWDTAQRHLHVAAADLSAYRTALLERFGNPRMRHQLAQIGHDGSRKLPARVLPVLRKELDAGNEPVAPARIIAAWIRHLRGETFAIHDPSAGTLTAAARRPIGDAIPAVLATIAPDLADNETLLRLVRELVGPVVHDSRRTTA